MNLSLLPPEALEDAVTDPEIIAAVSAAREAFFNSGISAAKVKQLHTRITDDIANDIAAQAQKKD
jgi:hypothetical protein